MKQTRITIRQDQVVILRGRKTSRAWCPACGAEADMIAVDRSTALPERTAGFLESVELHRAEAADGSPLICLKSLLGWFANKRSS